MTVRRRQSVRRAHVSVAHRTGWISSRVVRSVGTVLIQSLLTHQFERKLFLRAGLRPQVHLDGALSLWLRTPGVGCKTTPGVSFSIARGFVFNKVCLLLQHSVFCGLYRSRPDDLSSWLGLKNSWLLCKR